jgi:hypothetical protein
MSRLNFTGSNKKSKPRTSAQIRATNMNYLKLRLKGISATTKELHFKLKPLGLQTPDILAELVTIKLASNHILKLIQEKIDEETNLANKLLEK